MTDRPLCGISLHPDRAFLSWHRALIEGEAEVFEVVPESLWTDGATPGPAWELFREIRERSGRPFVAHGTLFSLGAAAPPPRRGAWLDALRRDQEEFDYLWFSDHLGFADCGAVHTALPLPLPACVPAVATCAAALADLRSVFPVVAFENNVAYFALGDPLSELDLFRDLSACSGAAMVLDLHNAYTQCENFELPLARWLDGVELDRVVEIHVSGGQASEPDWLASRRVFRLDSHDGRVPEPVWHALESVLPHCVALRAVILEQVPDDLGDAANAAGFASDFVRMRELVRLRAPRSIGALPAASGREPGPEADVTGLRLLQSILVDACLADDPGRALRDARARHAGDLGNETRRWLDGVDDDGLCLTGLLVQKLRFERLTRGDAQAARDFERDPERFTATWRAFARENAPAVFPEAEARAFAAFAATSR